MNKGFRDQFNDQIIGGLIENVFRFVGEVKTNWNVDLEEIQETFNSIVNKANSSISQTTINPLNSKLTVENEPTSTSLIPETINKLIKNQYISQRPFAKIQFLKELILEIPNNPIRDLFKLALASITIPSSNISFGPGFGLRKPRIDVDVLQLFKNKMARIIQDLKKVEDLHSNSTSKVILGDTRELRKYTQNEVFDYVITSPPYPEDHDYTRHTRLELALLDFASDMSDIRTIKKRMVRSSTRTYFTGDDDFENILKFPKIYDLTQKISKRVIETNGTSGFEKLYSKVVGEYFGGMYRSIHELYNSLESKGIAAFLVGDSHAFKMVHIETAKLLGEMAKEIGFSSFEIELWWNKRSTAHSFHLPEYILHLTK